MTSKNLKLTRSYVMKLETVELIDIVKEQHGVSASWIVNEAIKEFVKNRYNVE